MKPGRHWNLGASVVGFGVFTMLAGILFGTSMLACLGLAPFLIGLLLIYLPSGESGSIELAQAYALSSLQNVDRFIRELGPESMATYLKVSDRLDSPKVFVPIVNSPNVPSRLELQDQDRLIIVTEGDSQKTGLLLEAPGASLLRLIETEAKVDFYDIAIPNLMDTIKTSMVESLEIVGDVEGTFAGNQVKLKIRGGGLGSSFQTTRRQTLEANSRLGCPICSGAICAVVKSTKVDVLVETVAHEQDYHDLTLTMLRGGTDEAG